MYFVELRVSSPISQLDTLKNQKGKFTLATNELDSSKLPDSEVLVAYKGLSKVEKGFRFLKDPQFVASRLFVKKPERVEALLFIMTLCLTVYAALEYRIRQQLKPQEQYLPNQLGVHDYAFRSFKPFLRTFNFCQRTFKARRSVQLHYRSLQ